MPSAGGVPSTLPAALNRIGTAFASPSPTAVQPSSAAAGAAASKPAASSMAAMPAPAPSTRGPP